MFISNTVHDQVRDRLALAFDDLGEHQVKNIARPVRVYRVREAATAESPPMWAPSQLPLPDKPSIAVLPFANMSGDPEQEYFADGMVEEIITALSRIRWLFVIARNSSFTYKGQALDVKQVGRELGVCYVLEGSVRKAGGRVRIGLNFFSRAEQTLLSALQRPGFNIAGLRRADLLPLLGQTSPATLSRQLARLRHLGVIKRVIGTYRYYLARAGRVAIAAGRRLTEHTIIPALA